MFVSPPMSILPEDVFSTILGQLPVKSLLRFKCISKQFCSMIESEDFIKLHLSNNFVDNNTKLKLVHDNGKPSLNLTFSDLWHQSRHVEGPFGPGKTRILGSCNGLLCILEGDRGYSSKLFPSSEDDILPKIALWNPSTNKLNILRPAPSEVKRLEGYYSVNFGYAFGYDSVNDDYKVLRIVRLNLYSGWIGDQSDHIKDRSSSVFEVVVYSLKTNSWKAIIVAPGAIYDILLHVADGCEPLLACDAFHWHLFQGQESNVIAFDLRREEFYTMPLPNLEGANHLTLGVFGQCLCLKSVGSDGADIWMMKECGIKDSWVKLFSLITQSYSGCNYVTHALPREQPFSNHLMPLEAYSKDDDNEKLLLQQLFENVLMWYDLNRNEYECVWNPAEAHSYAYTFVESLVSPFGDGSKKNKNGHQCRNRTNKKKRGREE